MAHDNLKKIQPIRIDAAGHSGKFLTASADGVGEFVDLPAAALPLASGSGGSLLVAGNILPVVSGGVNLGSAAKPFGELYLETGTIHLGYGNKGMKIDSMKIEIKHGGSRRVVIQAADGANDSTASMIKLYGRGQVDNAGAYDGKGTQISLLGEGYLGQSVGVSNTMQLKNMYGAGELNIERGDIRICMGTDSETTVMQLFDKPVLPPGQTLQVGGELPSDGVGDHRVVIPDGSLWINTPGFKQGVYDGGLNINVALFDTVATYDAWKATKGVVNITTTNGLGQQLVKLGGPASAAGTYLQGKPGYAVYNSTDTTAGALLAAGTGDGLIVTSLENHPISFFTNNKLWNANNKRAEFNSAGLEIAGGHNISVVDGTLDFNWPAATNRPGFINYRADGTNDNQNKIFISGVSVGSTHPGLQIYNSTSSEQGWVQVGAAGIEYGANSPAGGGVTWSHTFYKDGTLCGGFGSDTNFYLPTIIGSSSSQKVVVLNTSNGYLEWANASAVIGAGGTQTYYRAPKVNEPAGWNDTHGGGLDFIQYGSTGYFFTTGGSGIDALPAPQGAPYGASINFNIADARVTLDEDDMASNSSGHLATQQSIKAYVDAEVLGGVGGGGSAASMGGAIGTVTTVDLDWTNGISGLGTLLALGSVQVDSNEQKIGVHASVNFTIPGLDDVGDAQANIYYSTNTGVTWTALSVLEQWSQNGACGGDCNMEQGSTNDFIPINGTFSWSFPHTPGQVGTVLYSLRFSSEQNLTTFASETIEIHHSDILVHANN